MCDFGRILKYAIKYYGDMEFHLIDRTIATENSILKLWLI